VGAIVAGSFARIFFRNAINLGIPLFIAPQFIDALSDGDEATLSLSQNELTVMGKTYHLPPLPDFAQQIVAAGGVVPYVKQHGKFPAEG